MIKEQEKKNYNNAFYKKVQQIDKNCNRQEKINSKKDVKEKMI